jgi:peptide chain release factor subunit 1
MQTTEIDPATLRRLSGLRPEGAKVLSLYLNLDPAEFATPPARETQVSSLLDEADRKVREQELGHDERRALGEDLGRVREFLRRGLPAEGARGLAVFCSGPADLFEVLKLPEPVAAAVIIDDSPWVEPLAALAHGETIAIALVNRRHARILRGTREALKEVEVIRDDTHGQHDQGGWSQPRYERSVDEEVAEHLRRSASALFTEYKRERFDRLLVGAPEELVGAFEQTVHPELRARLGGRVRVDVEHSRPEDVLAAAAEPLREADRAREREALDRLAEGLGRNSRAASGLADVLGALHERRVEILLYGEGLRAAGVQCPRCGWLGAQARACPVDGGPLEQRENIVENAVEAAILQSAEALAVRHHGDLARYGGIGAVLRF